MHFRQTVLTHVRFTPIALKNSLATSTRHRFNFLSESGVLAMMGERTVMQESLFYGFSLERHVPSDHMPRKIDRFVDLSGTWAHWVGIRPERRFCDEVHLNLAYRWFCRFHDSDLFRQRLETVVARCAGGRRSLCRRPEHGRSRCISSKRREEFP
jgi:hypothetical protein